MVQRQKAGSSRRIGERLEPRILFNGDFRSIDGQGNNSQQLEWGAANTQLIRLTSACYADDISEPAGGMDGQARPNPREISNRVIQQRESMPNDRALAGFVFQWGQFLDHDMDLTEEALPFEPFMVDVPVDDPHLDPQQPVPLLRSRYDPLTGTGVDRPRQQINQITSFIDASTVYGSNAQRAAALRTGQGGRLRTSDGNLLPFNDQGLHNAAPGPDPTSFFLAGDIRANEQPGLTSMHTLFLREHNRLSESIAARDFAGANLADPEIDEQIYQQARQMVGAEIQAITYQEFLPALLGPNQLAPYGGYDLETNPAIANEFSAAIYRVGHTMLPPELLRLDATGQPLDGGAIALSDAFFRPELTINDGIEPYLQGLGELEIQEIDAHIVDAVRNMLFDPPAQFDLAAINIQRGRDHGLPDYNTVRRELGLDPVKKFRDITTIRDTRRALNQAYDRDLNNIDLWVGAISEDHVKGGSVGELIHHVLVDQFTRLRDGDRFFYENIFEGAALAELQETRLADVILRNTDLDEMRDELFRSDSALVFRATDGAQNGVDLTATAIDGDIVVIDNRNGAVLARQSAGRTSTVVLFGTDGDDRLVIDGSLADRRMPVEVHGGAGDDWLIVHGGRRAERMMVHPNSLRINLHDVSFGQIEGLEVHGGKGNDLLRVRDLFPGQLILNGDEGRDRVIGGDGNELLLGGAGRDVVSGGEGRDILLGGAGRDQMTGRQGQDVLIHGTTDYDSNAHALVSLLAEWNSSGSYQERLEHLTGVRAGGLNGDVILQSGSTVHSDGESDLLIGGQSDDLFFVGAEDWMNGRRSSERVR